jgi:hypothetical protein
LALIASPGFGSNKHSLVKSGWLPIIVVPFYRIACHGFGRNPVPGTGAHSAFSGQLPEIAAGQQESRLPNCLQSRSANFRVTTDQGHSKGGSSSSNDAVGHIRYFVAVDELQRVGNHPVKRNQPAGGQRLV